MAPSLLVDQLRSEIATRGRTLAIIGTGVSTAASGNHPVASWKGLLRHGVQRCLDLGRCEHAVADRLHAQIDGDMIDLLCAAENISQRLGAPGPDFGRWLRETVGTMVVKNDMAIRALADLNVTMATTNYDDLIEQVTGMNAFTWLDQNRTHSWVGGRSHGVLHLHGFWDEPKSVVLGIRSYDEILKDEFTQGVMKAIRFTRTIVYIGFGAGLDDLNFGAFLRWSGEVFANSQVPQFRLCLKSELPTVNQQHPRNQRIDVIDYGDSHDELPDFLRSLR